MALTDGQISEQDFLALRRKRLLEAARRGEVSGAMATRLTRPTHVASVDRPQIGAAVPLNMMSGEELSILRAELAERSSDEHKPVDAEIADRFREPGQRPMFLRVGTEKDVFSRFGEVHPGEDWEDFSFMDFFEGSLDFGDAMAGLAGAYLNPLAKDERARIQAAFAEGGLGGFYNAAVDVQQSRGFLSKLVWGIATDIATAKLGSLAKAGKLAKGVAKSLKAGGVKQLSREGLEKAKEELKKAADDAVSAVEKEIVAEAEAYLEETRQALANGTLELSGLDEHLNLQFEGGESGMEAFFEGQVNEVDTSNEFSQKSGEQTALDSAADSDSDLGVGAPVERPLSYATGPGQFGALPGGVADPAAVMVDYAGLASNSLRPDPEPGPGQFGALGVTPKASVPDPEFGQGPGQFGALGVTQQTETPGSDATETAIPRMTPGELMHVLAGRLTPQREPETEPPATVTSVPPAAAFAPPTPKKKKASPRPFYFR